jgi:hypothetical protein
MQKNNIKNLKKHTYFFICPSVLRPNLASKKKHWQAPTKHKNIHICLVQALINHIMVSELPPDCPTLPDGRVLTATLVGMDKDRFSSMFLDGIQVRCASGSSCNVPTGADSVEKSPHRCMNCTLKFHS